MKRTTIISSALVALLVAGATNVSAQRRNTNAAAAQPAEAQPAAAQPAAAAQAGQEQGGTYTRPTEAKKSLARDGIFTKKIISTRTPTRYPYVREADVVWQQRIWRTVDLREKMNLPLYYPTEEMTLRSSLIQTLVRAIDKGDIRAFDPDEDDEFTTLLTAQEVGTRFDANPKQEKRQKMDGSGDTVITIPGAYKWNEVREFVLKEDWFFDRHYSKMWVRVVGICPIRVYQQELNTGGGEEETEASEDDMQKKRLFWINYEESRNVLAGTPAYVQGNNAAPISFDDIFISRRFEGYITKVENYYNNRPITSYTTDGYAALKEAEKVDNDMVVFELDMWEW
jgi:gliding motility associated protien GldN